MDLPVLQKETCAKYGNEGIDKYKYKSLVNSYYDLATLLYEAGWGQSFHFAYYYPWESFAESIRRHEYYLASKLGLSRNTNNVKLINDGSRIWGTTRNICHFTGADVTGITLNQYQVDRGNELNTEDSSLKGRCRSVQGDFMQMPFESASFDGAYAIEATCHAPDRVKCYSEIFQVLKPGVIFAFYEWCMNGWFSPK